MYENGVFRPLTRPEGIAEHRRVTLTVTAEEHPASLADFAGRISADDAQEMRERGATRARRFRATRFWQTFEQPKGRRV